MRKPNKQCMHCGTIIEGPHTGLIPALYPARMSTGQCPKCEARQKRLAKSGGYKFASRAMLSFHKNLFPVVLGDRRAKKPPRSKPPRPTLPRRRKR